jgi:hypothetical protein
MKIPGRFLIFVGLLLALLAPSASLAQKFPSTVIWSEADLPAGESASANPEQLAQFFPDAQFSSTDQLPAKLHDPQTRLLILPQPSEVPESAWSAILAYLEHGGNLLAFGGRPFTRAAYQDAAGWHLRDYSVRFIRRLYIDQYQATPASIGLQFANNPDVPVELPHFAWQQAYSPVIRLSTTDLYPRGGTAGSLDSRIEALAFGVANGRRLAAPVLQIDHTSGSFDGGRWIFLSADLAPEFYSAPGSASLVRALAALALHGAEEFTVRPTMPLYLPGEPIELETRWHAASKPAQPLTMQIAMYPEDRPSQKMTATATVPASSNTILAPPTGKGLYVIEARLLDGDTLRAIYRSAFWIRDEAFLRSGDKLGVNADYLTINEKPLAVVGTTYMSSEVQRLYFDHPNVYIWNRDLAQIHDAGLNMLRTGWWTGWEKFCDESGRPYERTLRTLEAYLMTARKNSLPVQFNFFAFLPDVLGGSNAYLDPEAVRRQHMLVESVVARFHDVPYVAWDLINEPSFSKHLWKTLPNDDPFELAAWNAWLAQRYPDRDALAAAWNVPPDSVAGTISLPTDLEFDPGSLYVGTNSLRVYDFYLFAEDTFNNWVRGLRDAIRETGSAQAITVGQDEGGAIDRLNPSFFAPFVDFTTNHTWWQNDHLLWDSLVAKQPGIPMLIQETGLQRELVLDEVARRTPESEATLFERKVAMSFVYGSGAIEWLWNTNAYMTEANELPIGALHADSTEKPEAAVLRGFAKFAEAASPYLKSPKLPAVAVVTSQAEQFSVMNELQLAAQRNAVRALGYDLHQPCYVIAENQIDKLGSPKLVILPSAQVLRESTWQALLDYVKKGGNLLVTGPVSRDEHWHLVDRLTPLGLKGHVEPLTSHYATVVSSSKPENGPGKVIELRLSFDQQKQQLLEYLNFDDASTFKAISLGKGKLFWAAYPLELAESQRDSLWFYQSIFEVVDVKPAFAVHGYQPSVNPGYGYDPKSILFYPIDLQDSVLYILESEEDRDTDIALNDASTGAQLKVHLPAQRAALAVIDKHTKQIVAKYGF